MPMSEPEVLQINNFQSSQIPTPDVGDTGRGGSRGFPPFSQQNIFDLDQKCQNIAIFTFTLRNLTSTFRRLKSIRG